MRDPDEKCQEAALVPAPHPEALLRAVPTPRSVNQDGIFEHEDPAPKVCTLRCGETDPRTERAPGGRPALLESSLAGSVPVSCAPPCWPSSAACRSLSHSDDQSSETHLGHFLVVMGSSRKLRGPGVGERTWAGACVRVLACNPK